MRTFSLFVHLVGDHFTVASRDWSCSKMSHGNSDAFVRGGVSYNSTTGYLTVPVTGIYFLYSQLHLIVNNISAVQTRTLRHHTVRKVNNFSYPLMKSYVPLQNQAVLAPTYQGGLFRLKAGESFAITVYYNGVTDPSSVFKYQESFVGVYLVSKEWEDKLTVFLTKAIVFTPCRLPHPSVVSIYVKLNIPTATHAHTCT